MDGVPVANKSEDEQDECDHQQPGCLRGIDRVPAVPVGRFVWGWHGGIVALRAGVGCQVFGVGFSVLGFRRWVFGVGRWALGASGIVFDSLDRMPNT